MATFNENIRANLRNLHVVLSYGPLGFVRAVTQSISRDRIKVHTGSIMLQRHAEVEIVMSICGEGPTQHHRIAAQVLECDDGGGSTLGFNCCEEGTMLALMPYLTRH